MSVSDLEVHRKLIATAGRMFVVHRDVNVDSGEQCTDPTISTTLPVDLYEHCIALGSVFVQPLHGLNTTPLRNPHTRVE